jgi:hypothetical protein
MTVKVFLDALKKLCHQKGLSVKETLERTKVVEPRSSSALANGRFLLRENFTKDIADV